MIISCSYTIHWCFPEPLHWNRIVPYLLIRDYMQKKNKKKICFTVHSSHEPVLFTTWDDTLYEKSKMLYFTSESNTHACVWIHLKYVLALETNGMIISRCDNCWSQFHGFLIVSAQNLMVLLKDHSAAAVSVLNYLLREARRGSRLAFLI